MKNWIAATMLMLISAPPALADTQVQLADGRVCWKDRQGALYGCSTTHFAIELRDGGAYGRPRSEYVLGSDGQRYPSTGADATRAAQGNGTLLKKN